MSANSIARWNAIPMERPQGRDDNSLKRTRDAMDADDSDDNVSIVSRTPSPPPEGDQMDVDKYDEYSHQVEHEVITVDTKIGSANKGFAMLAKLGWVEGQPLGLSAEGRVDPVPFVMKNDSTGLGKTTQDVRMIESTVSQRRELDSERQTRETEEQRKAREESVAKRNAVHTEISSVLRPFYCELCDKQFQNVAQYDEHTNSYAHHHKARLRDLQATQRATFAGDADKRKEKEKKREEKELRKIAKAAGIKMPKQPVPSLAATAPDPSPAAPPGSSTQAAPKKGAWATVSSSAIGRSQSAADVDSARMETSGPGPSQYNDSSMTVPQPPPQPHPSQGHPAPAFRTAGFTSLDTGSTVSSPTTAQPPPPPQASTSRGGWSSVSTPAPILSEQAARGGGWSSIQPLVPAAQLAPAVPVVQPSSEPRQSDTPKAQPAAQRQEAARSGWQQFKSGGSRRR